VPRRTPRAQGVGGPPSVPASVSSDPIAEPTGRTRLGGRGPGGCGGLPPERAGQPTVSAPDARRRPGADGPHIGDASSAVSGAAADAAPAPAASNPFDRLGHGTVAAIVDDLYRRVLGDRRLARAFAAADLSRLRAHQAALLAYVLGARGPQPSDKASLRAAHRGLGITDADVDALLGHLAAALSGAGIEAGLAHEVLTGVAWLAPHVVAADPLALVLGTEPGNGDR
jgi:hemoglobin